MSSECTWVDGRIPARSEEVSVYLVHVWFDGHPGCPGFSRTYCRVTVEGKGCVPPGDELCAFVEASVSVGADLERLCEVAGVGCWLLWFGCGWVCEAGKLPD